MSTIAETTIHHAFASIYDHRQIQKVEHPMFNIIFIAICGVLCGANNWVQISDFGKSQQAWLEEILDMPNGVPSHDTFGSVFKLLNCEEFSERFCAWMNILKPQTGKHIAIDGQLPRGSKDGGIGRGAIDIVSGYATECGLTLGQYKVDEKSNEITAIPELLKLLDIRGCVISIDAMGCQKEIARVIDCKEGDSLFSLKGNQGHLHEDVQLMFNYFDNIAFKDVSHIYYQQVNGGHGRIEKRELWAFPLQEHAEHFRTLDEWPTMRTAIMLRSQRQIDDKIEYETRYYISSLVTDAQQLLGYIRNHWAIENSLHWVLDVAFRHDVQRTRRGYSAANLVTLQQFALNLLRLDRSKGGIETRRLRCGWDTDYRTRVLAPILQTVGVN